MPLIYSAVTRGPLILAEYAVFAGNFASVAKDYLAKSTAAGRFSYTVDSHVFSFLAEDGFCELREGSSAACGRRQYAQQYARARAAVVPMHRLPTLPPGPRHNSAGFVVVTDEAAGRTIPNAFLDRAKAEFITKYGEKGKSVKELGLSTFG